MSQPSHSTLNENSRRFLRVAWLVVFTLCQPWFAHGATNVVDVYPADFQHKIGDNIAGANVVYAWEPDSVWANNSIRSNLTDMNVGMIRYPGGEVTDYFHWQNPNGQGWSDSWDPGWNPTNALDGTNWMGVTEYMGHVDATGAQPLLGINVDSGHVYSNRLSEAVTEATNFVTYALTNGYAVKYWFIGNESYHSSSRSPSGADTPMMTVTQYANYFNQYANAMRTVDPRIKLVANWNNSWSGTYSTLLNLAGTNIDMLEIHPYWNWGAATWANWIGEVPMQHGGISYADKIRQFRTNLDSRGYTNTEIGFFEYNLGPWSTNTADLTDQPSPFQVGLMNSEILLQSIEGGLDAGCFWPMNPAPDGSGDFRSIFDTNTTHTPLPVFYTLKWFGAISGQNSVRSTNASALISTTAALNPTENTLTTFILRKAGTNALIELNPHGFGAQSVKVETFQAPGGIITNDVSEIASPPFTNVAGGKIQFTVPPWSLTRVTLTKPACHIECGSITTNGVNATTWRSVTFSNTFQRPPVVLCGPMSVNGVERAFAVVRNVTTNGFEFRVAEWDFQNDSHVTETCHWLAVPEGVNDINGQKWEAGFIESDHQWFKANRLKHKFSQTPLIFYQAYQRDGSAVAPRLQNARADRFELRLVEEKTNNIIHPFEQVGYLAVPWNANGTLPDGRKYVALNTGAAVDNNWTQKDFGTTLTNHCFLAAMQTTVEDDYGCTLRYTNFTGASVRLKVDEENSTGTNTLVHAPENVAILVLGYGAGLASDTNTASVWTNDASGNWSSSTRWTNGIIANGQSQTAEFPAVITASRTVTNDTPGRIIGNLNFNSASASQAWTLAGTNELVLATTNGTPQITATGAESFIALPLGGVFGLTKAGGGTLTLIAASTFSGDTTISTGVLKLGDGTANSGSVPGNIINNAALTFANPSAQTATNAISGAGNVSKTGPGTLTLSGSHTYTGATSISAGRLALVAVGANSTVSNSAAIAVSAGAVLDVSQIGGGFVLGGSQNLSGSGAIAGNLTAKGGLVPGGSNTVGTLTFSNALTLSNSKLVFDITNAAIADKIVVLGSLTPGGVTVISLGNSAALTNGSYTLLEVTGVLGGSSANFSSASQPGGKTYNLVYQFGAPNKVLLQVSDLPRGITWTGSGGAASNLWNINTTTNWIITTNGNTRAVFLNGDAVTFDDIGITNPTVNVAATVSPSGVTVNSSGNYVFTGGGSISGSALLLKTNTGILKFAGVNDFSGGLLLNGGSLFVSSNNAAGAGIITLNNGYNTFSAVDRAVTLTNNLSIGVGTAFFGISGGGGATYGYSTNLTVSGNVNLGGGTRTVSVRASKLFLTGVVSNGGVIFNGNNAAANELTLSGANTYTGGTAIINGGTLNINNPTALGTGPLTVSNAGTIHLDNTSGGDITLVNNNAQFWNRNFTFDGSGNLNLGAGSVTMGVNMTVTANGSILTVGGGISDGGNVFSLTKAGGGTLLLTGTNTYDGATVISAGKLALAAPAGATSTISNTPGITVSSGATMDVSQITDGFVLRGVQTLAGSGSITGNVTVAAGGSIVPGGSNSAGTLAFGNNLTLANNTLVFDITNTASADKITVAGDLTAGGMSVISLGNSTALTNGDYTLLEVTGALNISSPAFSASSPSPATKAYSVIYQSGSPNKVLLRVTNFLSGAIHTTEVFPLDQQQLATNGPVTLQFDATLAANSATNLGMWSKGYPGLYLGQTYQQIPGNWMITNNAATAMYLASFTPAAPLTPGDLVVASIAPTLANTNGNQIGTNLLFSFLVDDGKSYGAAETYINPYKLEYGGTHNVPIWICAPTNGSGPFPVMFWVHGGGWGGGTTTQSEQSKTDPYMCEHLGVILVGVSYRCLGSGGVFSEGLQDVLDAVAYLRTNAATYHADTNRIGLYGGSAGTPLASLAAQQLPEAKCYVGYNGIYNFVTNPGSSFPGSTAYQQNVPSLAANSAIYNLRSNPPAVLLLHGTADTTISNSQSVLFGAAVAARGSYAKVCLYQDQPHAFFNPAPLDLITLYEVKEHARTFLINAQTNGLPGGQTTNPPALSTPVLAGNKLILTGTNGTAGGQYYVLSTTNVALPRANWLRVATNVFGAGGGFACTNTINPARGREFFILQLP